MRDAPRWEFSYDLSPMRVVSRETRQTAGWLLGLCAWVGGVYVVSGLLSALVERSFRAGSQRRETRVSTAEWEEEEAREAERSFHRRRGSPRARGYGEDDAATGERFDFRVPRETRPTRPASTSSRPSASPRASPSTTRRVASRVFSRRAGSRDPGTGAGTARARRARRFPKHSSASAIAPKDRRSCPR